MRRTKLWVLVVLAQPCASMRVHTLRLSATQDGNALVLPRADGVRRSLSTTGSPAAFGGRSPPAKGWFDGSSIGGCVVRRFTDEMHGDRWMMWYAGRPQGFTEGVMPIATGCIGLAQSKDGLIWEKIAGDEAGGSCLAPNDDDWWWFDTTHVGVGDVHVMSNKMVQNNMGLYWMYFFGGDDREEVMGSSPPMVGAAMSIGVALSNDGLHWGRFEGEHASGAVLEPLDGQLFVGWPQVVLMSTDPDLYHMYFHALDRATGKFHIGLAKSTNGVNFEHAGYCLTPGSPATFDEGGVSARCVLRDPDDVTGWLMFYEAQNAQRRHSIGLARSSDGVVWNRVGNAPVFEPQEGSWDDGAVSRPCIVPLDDGSARLYYLGRALSQHESGAASQGIGVACSAGSDWTSWARVNPDAVL
eukprot:CAMPEP_0119312336 /NCGR_PEP_ID=MMETSP1333-20130426/25968_1 /TAXON_ID=418940 /ORGANISM="Scyphosphaera apsteinii, Strain RCC1455" /LENGTH=411 /DNA_ID=CAMNT_0007316937 /DNA_START=38 /DNA_END=1273 /DNA_ORIENTATION=+